MGAHTMEIYTKVCNKLTQRQENDQVHLCGQSLLLFEQRTAPALDFSSCSSLLLVIVQRNPLLAIMNNSPHYTMLKGQV